MPLQNFSLLYWEEHTACLGWLFTVIITSLYHHNHFTALFPEPPGWACAIRTNQWPTSINPLIFTPDALPAASLPIYPGLGQAHEYAGLHTRWRGYFDLTLSNKQKKKTKQQHRWLLNYNTTEVASSAAIVKEANPSVQPFTDDCSSLATWVSDFVDCTVFCNVATWQHQITSNICIITFRMRHSRDEMYIGHGRLCVCVCLSLAAFPHYCMDPDVTWGKGRGALELCTNGRISNRCTGFVAMTTYMYVSL